MLFIDKLIKEVKKKKSCTVIGLDPVIEYFPQQFKKKIHSLQEIGQRIFEFNKVIIDSTYDLIPAVKPQIAFYERYGLPGLEAFLKTVLYAQKMNLIVIEDAKRNDIGSTAVAYSDGHLGKIRYGNKTEYVFNVDAITVNPYLGSDGIYPFIEDVKKYNKGVFILVKTSNRSSVELQDVLVTYKRRKFKFYELVAKYVNEWAKQAIGKTGYSSVGAVVGATFPKDASNLRKLLPKSYFLVPGYGAQGGRAKDMVRFFNNDGLGALISSSRGITYAYLYDKRYNSKNFDRAAREAVINMNEEINSILDRHNKLAW